MTKLGIAARGALAAGFFILTRTAGAEPIRLGAFVLDDRAVSPLPPASPGTDNLPTGWLWPREVQGVRNKPGSGLSVIARYPLTIEFPIDWGKDELGIDLRTIGKIDAIVFPIPCADRDTAAKARLVFNLKELTSLVRGLRPEIRIALSDDHQPELTTPVCAWKQDDFLALVGEILSDETIATNIDAVAMFRDSFGANLKSVAGKEFWVYEQHTHPNPKTRDEAHPPGTRILNGLRAIQSSGASRYYFGDVSLTDFLPEIARAQAYLTSDVSPQPAADRSVRFFDGKALTPIVFVAGSGTTKLDVLSGGPFREADVENLQTGARRTFPLARGSKLLDLDLSKGPLAIRLIPERKPGEVASQVTVGGEHALTAEEIIARERAWKAAQDDHVRSYTADLKTSLRFRIAEVNETFDLTIVGPLFKERGKDFDWAWEEFYVNGLKWKEKTLPKIPILQPEKVTTLPLEIELSEEYAYTLAGKTQLDGREAYEIDFAAKSSGGDKPLYKGRAWIDARTFALLKRRSVQQNLKGETLSNVETEYYRAVSSDPEAVLPIEIKGEEVFSTAGRTTAIERSVEMKHVKINPADFEPRRKDIYASPSQIVRDTPRGLKYLVPDPEKPGDRIVEEYVSKKNLFGVAGFFYDGALSYPIPLLGIQYFNFDLWKKGKQISVFFGGAVLTTNYTDPAFLGSRFDLGADVYGFAFPFGDTSYRDGKQVKDETVKHLPAGFQLNLGHPIGPYLKASLGLFTKYDNYQRDKDTSPDFVTPADTETFGFEAKLTSHISGFNTTLDYSKFHRSSWPFWGIPGSSEYEASQRDYEKYSFQIAKDYYFSNFRKFHAAISYLGGDNLDRFSRYEFGAFSGNPIRGYNSGSLRTKEAWLMNLSYGLNIEDIIRLEGVYDQAIITDSISGFRHQYYSGAGISGQLNGPWRNSLIRFDVGVPVVSHGVHGVSASALILKLF